MTTQATIRKEVEHLKKQVAFKLEDVVTVTLRLSDGQDKPFCSGDKFRIKACRKPNP